VRIQHQGAIKSIDLPDGWVEAIQDSEPLASQGARRATEETSGSEELLPACTATFGVMVDWHTYLVAH